MSYLHCPSCMRAYNLAVRSTCPYCPVAATEVDPAEDIVHAAEQLARAMDRATPAERSAAASRMDHLALPAPGDESAHRAPVMRRAMQQIRDVLDPLPVAPTPKPTLFLAIASEVERRFLGRMQNMPKLPRLLGDGLRRVRARVKALAQAA